MITRNGGGFINNMRKRIQTIRLSAILTLVLVLAATLAPVSAQAAKKVKAKKVKVNVLVEENADYGIHNMKYAVKGDMAGLLKTIYHDAYDMKIRYATAKKMKNIKYYNWSGAYGYSIKYTYKKGRIKKITIGKTTMTLTYNAKGLVKKAKVSGTFYNPFKEKKVKGSFTNKYTYNKKGLLTKANTYNHVYTYKYDKKKNITRITDKDKVEKSTVVWKYKNVYKKGLLVKRNVTSDEGEDTITYKYKSIKVSKATAKTIKKQQHFLLNHGNPNNYIYSAVNLNVFPVIDSSLIP